MSVPKDPIILLSYVNTKLRDYYPNLDAFCDALEVDKNTLIEKLASINYFYDENQNCFN